MSTSELLRLAAEAALGLALALGAIGLAGVGMSARPELGHRGVARRRMLEGAPAFRAVEPLLRATTVVVTAAARILRLEPARDARRERDALLLEQAGEPWGITPDELLAGRVLGAAAGALAGAALSAVLGQGYLYLLPAAIFGAAAPTLQLRSEATRRFKRVKRLLPPAIDLAALAVGAGLDFPSAVRSVVSDFDPAEPLTVELGRVLEALALGQTRREALQAFERRVPIGPVRDLVRALVLAEEKGTPVAEALAVQARMGRLQRSVAAEELAVRAGVLMLVPMLLLMGCVLLLLLGPFLATGVPI